jgi:hypothetical protein
VFSRVSALRVAAHVVAWLPFVYAGAREVHDGWRPVSDNAGIALRSWDVLSAHAPLVGQATRLASGVYDPGPLQYWLLTVPVHIDPVHGVLWGAALWCMLAASLTIEAAWSVAGRLGGLIATGVILGAIAWIPAIALLPCWNPWFGLMYFLAELAACWAVMSGHRGWGPVLVIAGSIAAQAHLMYTVTAVAVVLLGLIVGLVDTYRAKAGYRWAIVSVVAGLACWSAPLIQEFTTRNGNLSALASGKGTPGALAGLPFGLKALAAAAQPPPFWWSSITSLGKLSLINQRSAAAGAVVLALAVAVLAVALYVLRSRRIAALAAVSLTVTVTAFLMYAHIPKSSVSMSTTSVNNLRYLMAPMFAVGVLAWLSLGAVCVQAAAARRARRPAAAAGDGTAAAAPRPTTARWAAPALGLTAVAFVALAALVGLEVGHAGVSQSPAMRAVGTVFPQIEHAVSRRPLALSVIAESNQDRRQVTFGLMYALNSAGYRPEISNKWALQLGSIYEFHGKPMTHVTVLVRGAKDGHLSVQVSRAMAGEALGRGSHPPGQRSGG